MDTPSRPLLSEEEIRVLGVLIEKSRTTPDYYPMTINAITTACNQKTSRFPVTDYNEETVSAALNSLKGRSLVATAVGGTIRTTKFKHNFTTVYPVSNAELAILCLLFLRGAQTPGELNTNSARLHTFISLREVIESLHHLTHLEEPFVMELPKRAGQKEARFVHLMGSSQHFEQPEGDTIGKHEEGTGRIEKLEAEMAEVKAKLELLMKKFFEGEG